MVSRRRFLGILLAAPLLLPQLGWAQSKEEAAKKEAARIARWETQVAEFEKQDAAKPTKSGGIVFVGSSTIRLWNLAKSFPGLPVLNRGFGGSHLADTHAYLPRLVVKHKPRTVVIYAGGNDLASGKTPEAVLADFQAIHTALQRELPECQVIFLGLRPTLQRLAMRPKEKDVNDRVRAYLADKPRTTFLECDKEFCNDAGKPRADLLRADKLHLNDAGYVVLSDLLRPLLTAPANQPSPR